MGSAQHLDSGELRLGDGLGDFIRFTSDAPVEVTRVGKDRPGPTGGDRPAGATRDLRGNVKESSAGAGQ